MINARDALLMAQRVTEANKTKERLEIMSSLESYENEIQNAANTGRTFVEVFFPRNCYKYLSKDELKIIITEFFNMYGYRTTINPRCDRFFICWD